jgi:tRNA wybutosine-synthesizing protein 3
VDLINSHSRFCTLSSCSGRLSLFDPTGNGNSGVGNGEINNNNNNINGAVKASNNHFTEASGKGRGRWVLVSHDPISPDALVEAMVVTQSEPEALCCGANDEKHDDDDDDEEDDEEKESKHIPSPWTFRFEPMLLHIAAASLQDGRRLLTIALNLGFRESGLVVTDKRVTVAIRSHSLATATPLFPSSGKASDPLSPSSFLCVPPSFLRALANDANQRLEANWSHLDRLYRSIESTLFEVLSSPPPLVVRNQSTEIPTLNLWNAASIGPAVSNTNFLERKQDVWILGGYGCGPNVSGKKRPSAKRSSKLYRLEEAGWREHSMSSQRNGAACGEPGVLKLARGNHETTIDTRLGVNWWNDESKAVPDLQGMASCRWRKDLSLFWGGRKGPSTPAPSDDLYVLEDSSERIGTVRDIRGELPRPRWGHQLVSLDDDRAVLLGGCNLEDGALDDVFVLHFCTETVNGSHATDDTSLCGYFYWVRLSIRLPTPRFHFGAALLNGSTIVVVGGLESTQELLQPFEGNIEPSRSESAAVWACRFKRSRPTCKSKSTAPKTRATSVRVETPVGAFTSFFGMACCTLLSKNLLLVTGGIQQNASTTTTPSEPIQAYWISGGDSSTLRIQRIHLSYDVGNFDFGCLVHHCCIPLADNELLLVGGGVPSFAFGESYSR